MAIADLHIHSNCSDGSDTVKELAYNIKKAGINIFALTDHDTVDGISEMEKYISDDIKFIKGIELTCLAGNIKCHILGYSCNPNNETLQALIAKGKILRKAKLEKRIQYLKDVWDIELTKKELDWLYSRKSVVKTHLANVLVRRGLAPDNLSAMSKYLDACKTGNSRFDGEEGINAIIASGGIPVWAHPLGGEGETHIGEEEFSRKLTQMIQYGIKGIECYYSRYNEDEINLLVKSAEKYNLFITGGSDYHGTNKTIPLAKLNTENLPIDSSKFTILESI